MSRPMLSSAARQLSRQPPSLSVPHCQRSFSTSQPALKLFSASSDTPVSPRSIRSPFQTSKNSRPTRYNLRRAGVTRLTAPRQRAAFSSSSVRPATQVVQNAKNDEEGKPLMVEISSRAAEVGRCDLLIPLSISVGLSIGCWARGVLRTLLWRHLDEDQNNEFGGTEVLSGPDINLYSCRVQYIRP